VVTMTPETADLIAARVSAGLADFFERNGRRTALPHPTVYASARRVCDRRMYYELTEPGSQQPVSTDVLARFVRGNDRERDWTMNLTRAGRDAEPSFAVVEQQRTVEIRDRKGRRAISGRVDLHLKFADSLVVPVEMKAWSQYASDRVRSLDDVFESPWTSAAGYQLLAYQFATALPIGLLFLDRPGLPLILPCVLEHHYDRMESFIAAAERVLDAVEESVPPPYLEGDAAECNRCPFFGGTCNPPLMHDGMKVLTDPELEALLSRREELLDSGKEFEKLDAEVKARLRGTELAVAGPFAITGRWSKSSRLVLPPDLKQQFTETDPKGKFTLSITRVDGDAKESTR
jgi:hypothetical protein